MSIVENKKLIKGYFGISNPESIKSKKPRELEPFHSSKAVIHTEMGDLDLKQFNQLFGSGLSTIPDLKFTILDLVAEGNKVVARYQFSGTPQGTFMNIAAAGKKFSIQGIGIYRIARGKIVEAWYVQDMLSLMQQLGAISKAAPNI